MADRPEFDPIRAALYLIAGVSLSACADDAIMPHPVPIALSHPLKVGEQVTCTETLTRFGVPNILPVLMWARRTFICELHATAPAGGAGIRGNRKD